MLKSAALAPPATVGRRQRLTPSHPVGQGRSRSRWGLLRLRALRGQRSRCAWNKKRESARVRFLFAPVPCPASCGASNFSFESAFVVNSTSPMVPCKRSIVAVAHTHTPRRTARPPAAPPRRERDEEMGQRRRSPTRMGGFSCAPRCPAFLTFRDSPALSRQESDGYPVRACRSTRRRPPILPSSFPPRMLRTPTSRPTMGPCPARSRPSAPHTHPGPTCTYKTNPASCSQKKKKKWEGGDQRGRLPAYATPQRGAAIAEAVLKHNSKTRSGPGGLGGSLPDRRCTGLDTRR